MGWGTFGDGASEPLLSPGWACLSTCEVGDHCLHLPPTFVILALNFPLNVNIFTPVRDKNIKKLFPPEVLLASRATHPRGICCEERFRDEEGNA